MELFWKILPFLIPLWLLVVLIIKYRNGVKEDVPKPSWLSQQSFYKYVKLVFVTRANLRPWTAIWHIPLWLSGILFLGMLVANFTDLIYPPLPLEKMQSQHGIIESITIRKKMDDLLILRTDTGAREKYSYRLGIEGVDFYADKNVTIFYSRGFSSLYSIDNVVYQIIFSETNSSPYPYDYKRELQFNKSSWSFMKNCFYIALFSALMIWIPNRKEFPIHRLNRMRLYKKTKGVK